LPDVDRVDERSVRRTFATRWKVAAFVTLLYGLANLIRVEAPLGGVVPAGAPWLSTFWMWLMPLWIACLVWAARCPACAGFIRLDGRTCSSCKRDLRKPDTTDEVRTP
jgi:hypothetical protein